MKRSDDSAGSKRLVRGEGMQEAPKRSYACMLFYAVFVAVPYSSAAAETFTFSAAYEECRVAAGEDWEKKFGCTAAEQQLWTARLARAITSMGPLNATRPAFMEKLHEEIRQFETETSRSCIQFYLPAADDLGHHKTHYITGICSLSRLALRAVEMERLAEAFFAVGLLPNADVKREVIPPGAEAAGAKEGAVTVSRP